MYFLKQIYNFHMNFTNICSLVQLSAWQFPEWITTKFADASYKRD